MPTILVHIKNLFRLGQDVDPSKIETNPYRDWKIMLSLFFVLLIAVAAFDSYTYFMVQDDSLSEESAPGSIETLDRRKLEEALTLFQEKEKAFDALVSTSTERARIPDPSR